ncbi:hybrid sensor histidine kinase/response regulator, partial [Corynebacterium pseudodiphtheriticum]
MLTQPLVRIIRALSTSKHTHLDCPPGHENDEIGVLVNVANQQFENMQTEIQQRRHAEDRLTEYLGQLEDIVSARTLELKASNQRLIQSNDELEAAKMTALGMAQARAAFLANMSHEIRTPMNAVIGMIELALKNAEQGRADRDALEVASVASRGMLELIGDILDIARIESGHLSLALQPANLHELLASVVRVFEGLGRVKELVLQVELDPRKGHIVMLDPLRFKQVISNLLSNAIKFTPQGQVKMGAQVLDEGEYLSVQLWMQDTGVGISAQDQQRLFN